eukprot:10976075-Alexandrium_andersonii.AAC.1
MPLLAPDTETCFGNMCQCWLLVDIAVGLSSLPPTGPLVKKLLKAATARRLSGGAAVSYTHLTLPTICSV